MPHRLSRPAAVSSLGVALLAVNLLSSPAHAIAIRSDVDVSNYNAIAQLPQFQSATFLKFYTTTPSSDGLTISLSTSTCSGTLISPTKILSAAHCFVNAETGVVASPTQQIAGFDTTVPAFNQSGTSNFSVVYDPQYASGPNRGLAVNDIAILTLNAPVTNVTPAQLFAGNALGAMSAMVGYGGQNTGTTIGGIPGATDRLGAYNTIDVFNTDTIQFDFDSPDLTSSTTGTASPLALEGSVVQGDSGSALFALINGTWVVVGDLNSGSNPITGRANNLYGEVNAYAPVMNASNFSFIQENAPDAVFDRRAVVNGVTVLTPVSDAVLAQNVVKFGSIIDPSDLLDLAPEVAVPEPASLLLLGLGVGAATLARSRTARRTA